MMPKRLRTSVVVRNDRLEDGIPRHKKQLRSYSHTQSSGKLNVNKSLKIGKDNGIMSISTQYDSPNSDYRKKLHAIRQGSIQTLGDIDTADFRSLRSSRNILALGRHQRDATQSLIADSVPGGVSESCSDDSLVHTRSSHTQKLNPDSSSILGDSGIPNNFRRPRKSKKLSTSSEQNNSGSFYRRVTRSMKAVDDCNTTNRSSTSKERRQVTLRNTSPEPRSSRTSLLNKTVRARENALVQREDEFTNDSDIRPKNLRNGKTPISVSDHTTSSNNSDENVAIQNHRRLQTALVAFPGSEEDTDMQNVNEILTSTKTSLGHSSNSDGKSEKCPICLAQFILQEVGTPSTCDHSFCSVCIQEWAKNNNSCPIDRQLFNSIMVRAHVQGEIIREIPVSTISPNPQSQNVLHPDSAISDPHISFISEIMAYISRRQRDLTTSYVRTLPRVHGPQNIGENVVYF